ncbi:lysostaphin resistance A-like protein [Fictibacillus aquaticus]|uniref:CPBP family intramembrane metalloprotease n=1 Tax=Fictibacillus aquaticus TaxID=2021314 RepID=A0A235F523_9BACL|nr:CPBP family intramembrane glutamic endopeptidase [Fictibacillus aquaticus]OYD56396.1 CPBP family intramembrane metalloprotease [Fictibacillus aquaticus]
MEKRYWWIIFIYFAMQFSGILAKPILTALDIPRTEWAGLWGTYSFALALILILILLRPDIRDRHQRGGRVSRGSAVLWAIGGIFMAYAAQIIAITIESKIFGVPTGSQNTKDLVEITKHTPYFMVVAALIGPILEEIVFRKILFGRLYGRFGFFLAALISSLVFAAVHMDFSHLLIYSAIGFTFAYLYVKTKRLLVPIIAHMSMNSLVLLVQFVFADQIREYEKQMDTMQFIFGGFLS